MVSESLLYKHGDSFPSHTLSLPVFVASHYVFISCLLFLLFYRPSLFTLPQYMCHFLFLLHGLDTPTHSPFPYFFLFYKEMRIVRCSSHENSNFTAWVFRNTVRKSTTMTTPLYFLGHLTLDCIINGPYTKKKKKKVFLDILNCKMRGLGTSHIQLRGKPLLLEIVFMRSQSFPTMNQVILLPKRTLDRSLDAIWTLCLWLCLPWLLFIFDSLKETSLIIIQKCMHSFSQASVWRSRKMQHLLMLTSQRSSRWRHFFSLSTLFNVDVYMSKHFLSVCLFLCPHARIVLKQRLKCTVW